MKILFAAFGSAGDLLPLVPVASELASRGHEVRWAVPRSLGLYLRFLGWTSVAIGDGAEMRVFADQQVVSRDFDGWRSWRRTMTQYVTPSMTDGLRDLERHHIGWQADVVVGSGFAVAARLFAHRNEIALVECSIYPQFASLRHNTRLARSCRDAVSRVARTANSETIHRIQWGSPPDILLHDSELVASSAFISGFPYWDDLPPWRAGVAPVLEWLEGRPGKKVLCTFGSFLGAAQVDVVNDLVHCAAELDLHVVIAGISRERIGPLGSDVEARIFVAQHVRTSLVASSVDAVVHHGGVGTTFACLHAARPAVVFPLAFDQPHNARIVERVGVGVDATNRKLRTCIQEVVYSDGFSRRSQELQGRLVQPRVAALSAALRVEQLGASPA